MERPAFQCLWRMLLRSNVPEQITPKARNTGRELNPSESLHTASKSQPCAGRRGMQRGGALAKTQLAGLAVAAGVAVAATVLFASPLRLAADLRLSSASHVLLVGVANLGLRRGAPTANFSHRLAVAGHV